MEMPDCCTRFRAIRPKCSRFQPASQLHNCKLIGESVTMNKTILLSTALIGSILAAMVLAAPQTTTFGTTASEAPSRAAAYTLAMAD